MSTIRLELARAEDAGDPHAFRTGPQEYILRWEGGAFESARLVWDDDLLQDLAAVRLPGRDPELVRRVGARLQRFLESTRFREWAAHSFSGRADRRRDQLDIVSAAAELYALPWELLTLPDGRHLGELPDLLIQYQWPGTSAVPPARDPRPEGGRIVVAWSRAFGNVGEAHTVDAIQAAARAGFQPFDPDQDVLADISLSGLVEALERRTQGPDPPAVLHVLAHGAAVGESYGLGLGDGRGGREVVDSAALRRALAPFAPQLRLVVLTACDSGNPGPLGARLGSAVQELHRAGFEAVVGSRYPLAGSAALDFTRALYTGLLEQTCSVEQAFVAARTRLARAAGLDWASLALYGHGRPGHECRPIVFRPHRGLLAFEREHARFFFGRDDERREAIADLQTLIAARKSRFLVVAGASGTGKSSVVLAGIVPDLEAMGWVSAVMRPGRAPMRALDDALARRPTDGRPFLLVVDQFEEIFTHAGEGEGPSAFARRIWDLSQSSDSHTQVILTLRVDYLGRCGEVVLDDAGLRLDRIAYDEAYRVFIAQMAPDKLAQTIEGPVGRVGLHLEPGLGRRLLDEIGSDPVGLPLLQYALDELWKRRQGDTLTHAALEEIGGVVGALTRHADAIFERLAPDEQTHARRLLVRLVAYGSEPSSGTRRRESLADLRPERDAAAFDRATEALIDARLLVRRQEPGAGATLEVAHEALIRHWQRLWNWYDQDRDALARHRTLEQIVSQATEHRELLTGNTLAAAETLVKSFGDEADPDARALVLRSRAAADRSARIARITRAITFASLLATIVVVLYSRASVSRQSSLNKDGARLAVAFLQLYERPNVSAALLKEIEHTEIRQWRQAAFVATQSLLPTSIVRLDPTAGTSPVTAVALAPDGAAVITGHRDGSVRAWPRRSTGQDLSVLLIKPGSEGSDRAIDELVVQADADGYALLAAGPRTLHLWRRRGDAFVPALARDDHDNTDDHHLLSPDGLVGVWHSVSTGASFAVMAPVDGALALQRRWDDCKWVDPGRERVACHDGADDHLYAWTSGESLGVLRHFDYAQAGWGFSDDATLFHDPGRHLEIAHIVDPTRQMISEAAEAFQPVLGPRDLHGIGVDDQPYGGQGSPTICRIERSPGATIRCTPLLSTCVNPKLLGVHDELGALVLCQGQQPWPFFVTPGPLDTDFAFFRHDILPPDTPTAAFLLSPGGDDLVAVTHDNQLWQWSLRDPPSGWIPYIARGPGATLVDGTAAILELAPRPDGQVELQHVRWDRPTAPPAIDAVVIPTDAPDPRVCCLDAGAAGYVGALAGDGLTEPRRPGAAAPAPPEGTVFWGGFPLAPPHTRRHPIGVEHLSGEARVGADRIARHAAGTAAVLPADATIELVDLADARAPRVFAASPTVRDGPLERSDILVAAAFHPGGQTLAIAWSKGQAAIVERRTGALRPLPREPSSCGELDPASNHVTALAHDPTGRWLALGHTSGRLELVPLRDDGAADPDAETRTLCRQRDPIRAIAFTPDGATVLTGSARGGLLIWSDFARPDVRSADPIFQWLPGRPAVRDLTIAGDRLYVLMATGHLFYTHVTFDAAGLAERLGRASTLCLGKNERELLLNEDAETAAAAEAACFSGQILPERKVP